MDRKETTSLSSPVLAYMGDAVFEMMVRDKMIRRGTRKMKELHRQTVGFANASFQAALFDLLEEELDEEEKAVARRGRNSHQGRVPKNADMTEYRKATGLEALLGWLYFSGGHERIDFILEKALEMKGE